jgi:hypothetical protein
MSGASSGYEVQVFTCVAEEEGTRRIVNKAPLLGYVERPTEIVGRRLELERSRSSESEDRSNDLVTEPRLSCFEQGGSSPTLAYDQATQFRVVNLPTGDGH